jgi:hypothetical protein
MASALPIGTLASVTSVLAAILYHGNRDNLEIANEIFNNNNIDYHDFRDRVLLLTRKLLKQGFLLVKLKPSSQMFYRHSGWPASVIYGAELRSLFMQ